MRRKKWLGKALLYAVLEVGALCGVPIRPDQIEELLKQNERVAVSCVKREDDIEGPKHKKAKRAAGSAQRPAE